jgi:HSP20 family protein
MANPETRETKSEQKPREERSQAQQGQRPQGQQGREMERQAQAQGRLARREQLAPAFATPFTFMRRFTEEMDRLFEDILPGAFAAAPALGRELAARRAEWAPRLEMFERKNELVVRADLPGLKKEHVNVHVDRDSITIEGERKEEREEEERGYYRAERVYGSFCRTLPLPEGIDPDKAKASFRNGVLEITLPMRPELQARPRKVEIKEEEEPRGQA